MGLLRFEKECEGQTPRAPRHLAFVHYLDDVPCREAAITPAALRPRAKFEWIRDGDINGVWGAGWTHGAQETFYNSAI